MGFTAARRPHEHGRAGLTAVLLVQLGTPERPEAGPVRRYLAQFLADPRVVELPAFLWRPLLHGVILRVRPARSARKYASIWTDEGSPLAVHTRRQATLLQACLGERGQRVQVSWAMRYGEPALAAVLRALREDGLARLLVLPLYPQYAGSTTATVNDAVFAELARWRNQPELRTIRGFAADRGYIDALAKRIEARWQAEGRPQHLVMSFHGVPERTLTLGDPYHCECLRTGRLLGERLGLAPAEYAVTFQSRFGKARWLQPYTDKTLVELARAGVVDVDVVCPGFVADCLETLEEISIEARQAFLGAGGRRFRYHECLNEDPEFIQALADLIGRHLAGWPTGACEPVGDEAEAAALRAQRERALARGATA